jgi:hypothetical protein
VKVFEFTEIQEEPKHNDLEIGMLFMEGKSMISQKSIKKPGDWVTYYEVTGKTGNLVEYKPVSVKLEGV